MAIKTFTTGEVLTAADTNTYLGNAGLVYVTQQTIGSAVASVTISNAFSTTYDNYRIVITKAGASASVSMCINFSTSAVSYFGIETYTLYNAATVTIANNNNDSKQFLGLTDSGAASYNSSFDVFSPFLASTTQLTGQYYGRGYIGYFGGSHEVSASHTSFKLFNESGTLTGGTVTVFGYRKS
jgi:hypothetical protein